MSRHKEIGTITAVGSPLSFETYWISTSAIIYSLLRSRAEWLQPPLPLQIPIDSIRRLPPFGDCPHHQRLSAPHVARREHARHARHVVGIRRYIAARVQIYAKLLDHTVLHRAREAHRQQHQ